MKNIKEYGALGNAVDNDSAAIQKAFDEGGEITFPAGQYLLAGIKLRDNCRIILEPGAQLTASRNLPDYGEASPDLGGQRHFMISAEKVKNTVICGAGVIEGNGDAFWSKETFKNSRMFRPLPQRPVMLYLKDCQQISLQDIKLSNAAAYTVWALGCDNLNIFNLTIRNQRVGPNTDALDIDCSRNVRISHCDIISGDDCIALKSDTFRLGRNAPCENVAVSNCLLSSSTCAIRIGYEGDGVIRDCVFSGLLMYDCAKGIAMQSIVPVPENVPFTKIFHGASIERMIFSDIVLRDVKRAFFIWSGDSNSQIRDLTCTNLLGNQLLTSYIGGKEPGRLHNFFLSNIHLQQDGEIPPDKGDEVPGVWGHLGFKPWSMHLRNIQNLQMREVTITPGKVSGSWQGDFLREDCK